MERPSMCAAKHSMRAGAMERPSTLAWGMIIRESDNNKQCDSSTSNSNSISSVGRLPPSLGLRGCHDGRTLEKRAAVYLFLYCSSRAMSLLALYTQNSCPARCEQADTHGRRKRADPQTMRCRNYSHLVPAATTAALPKQSTARRNCEPPTKYAGRVPGAVGARSRNKRRRTSAKRWTLTMTARNTCSPTGMPSMTASMVAWLVGGRSLSNDTKEALAIFKII